MTAAELIEALNEAGADARVRVIGKGANHDLYAVYRGQDGNVYVVVADVADEEHPSCGTEDCCGTC